MQQLADSFFPDVMQVVNACCLGIPTSRENDDVLFRYEYSLCGIDLAYWIPLYIAANDDANVLNCRSGNWTVYINWKDVSSRLDTMQLSGDFDKFVSDLIVLKMAI